MHSWLSLQSGALGSPQSVVVRQAKQACPSQNGLSTPQSACSRHSTPTWVSWSQTDRTSSVQSVLARHSTHTWVSWSQTDRTSSVQSVLARHSTHTCASASQTARCPLQSVASRHWTQVRLVGSQTRDPSQSWVCKHCTQVFSGSSQMGESPLQAAPQGSSTLPAVAALPTVPAP